MSGGYGIGRCQTTPLAAIAFNLQWRDKMHLRYPTMHAMDDASFIAAVRLVLDQVHAEAVEIATRTDAAFAERVAA